VKKDKNLNFYLVPIHEHKGENAVPATRRLKEAALKQHDCGIINILVQYNYSGSALVLIREEKMQQFKVGIAKAGLKIKEG